MRAMYWLKREISSRAHSPLLTMRPVTGQDQQLDAIKCLERQAQAFDDHIKQALTVALSSAPSLTIEGPQLKGGY